MNPLLPVQKTAEDLLEQIELLHEENASIPVQEHFKLIKLSDALKTYLDEK